MPSQSYGMNFLFTAPQCQAIWEFARSTDHMLFGWSVGLQHHRSTFTQPGSRIRIQSLQGGSSLESLQGGSSLDLLAQEFMHDKRHSVTNPPSWTSTSTSSTEGEAERARCRPASSRPSGAFPFVFRRSARTHRIQPRKSLRTDDQVRLSMSSRLDTGARDKVVSSAAPDDSCRAVAALSYNT